MLVPLELEIEASGAFNVHTAVSVTAPYVPPLIVKVVPLTLIPDKLEFHLLNV